MEKKKNINESMEEKESEEESVDQSSAPKVGQYEERKSKNLTPPIKKTKFKPSQDILPYVQLALRQLNQASDEEQVFGDFCASELRQIKNPTNKWILKRIVMEAITNVGEAEALGVIYKLDRQNININNLNSIGQTPGTSSCSSSPRPGQNHM